jgi:drug/metabolite transporter (DMT)-like permease
VIDYLSLAVIWGLSFLLLLKVVQAFGWVGAVTFRAFIASAILTALAVVSGRKLVFGRRWPWPSLVRPQWRAS